MTKKRTLSEAAVDILQSSAKTGQEPMHKVDTSVGAPAAAIVDLGGATVQDPSGGNIGQKAAAARSQASAPKGPVVAGEAIKKVDTSPGAPQLTVTAEAKPTMATPSGDAPTANNAVEAKGICGEEVEPTAEEIEQARTARLESVRATMKTLTVDEDVNAIFAGSDLTEEFKTKVKTIFEAAVVARAVLVVEQMEKEIITASEESVAEIKEELETQVDSYLDHMVSEWMTENKVAIESGLRTEISEEFIDGLRSLFLEHNMTIPEESVNVVETLTAEVETLKGKLNESLNNNVELSKRINTAKKDETIAAVCEGLTATQTEKLKTLAEGVEFTTEGEYKAKLDIIRGQYFSNQVNNKVVVTNPVALIESADQPSLEEVKQIDPEMSRYVNAIGKTLKK